MKRLVCVVAVLLLAIVAQAGAQPVADLGSADIYASREAAVRASGLDLSHVILMRPLAYHRGVALYQIEENGGQVATYAFVEVKSEKAAVPFVYVRGKLTPIPTDGAADSRTTGAHQKLAAPPVEDPLPPPPGSGWCAPDGGFDDTLYLTHCCSGVAVGGSTVCVDEADWGTTWASCSQICGSQLVGGCVPSGGVDDTLYNTHCCSFQAVSGSTRCLNPADYGTTWRTCIQTCQ